MCGPRPSSRSPPASWACPCPVTLKLELLQHTGSFKPRGAFHRVLRADVPPAGLIAASGGNHGAAVAHVAGRLGHRAEVFVPSTSPAMKRDRIAALGADVRSSRATTTTPRPRAERARRRDRRAARASLRPRRRRRRPRDDGPRAGAAGRPARHGRRGDGRRRLHRRPGRLVRRSRARRQRRAGDESLPARRAGSRPAGAGRGARARRRLARRRHSSAMWRGSRCAATWTRRARRRRRRSGRRSGRSGTACASSPSPAAPPPSPPLRTGAYVPAPGERVAVVVCGANCDPTTVM